MPKRIPILGLLFTLLYLTAMFKPFVPWVVYYLNYDEIVNEKCVNRDKPYILCKGQCYVDALRERLGEDKDTKTPVPAINLKEFPVVVRLELSPEIRNFDFSYVSNTFWVPSQKPKGYINKVFKPPKHA